MTKIPAGEEPCDGNIRDSSMVSAETDTAFICWRSVDKANTTMVKVGFHRRTGVFDERFEMIKKGNLLQEGDQWS